MADAINFRPLDAFPIIRSSNPEQVEDLLKRSFGARRFNLPRHAESLNVRANHWQSEDIALSYCSYGAAVQLDFPAAHFYRQQFGLRSGADVTIGQATKRATNAQSIVVPPELQLGLLLAQALNSSY